MITKRLSELNTIEKDMRAEAKKMTDYGRYLKSTTKVGCCILSNKNIMYYGVNYDWEFHGPVHGETSAINDMIVYSEDFDEKINIVYVYVTPNRYNFTPCGDCRGKILQFCEDIDTTFIYVDSPLDDDYEIKIYTLKELMPYYPKR